MKKRNHIKIHQGQILGFIGNGYSVSGWGGYVRYTVVRSKKNVFWSESTPAHWNREVFERIERTGKLYAGSGGGETEADQMLRRIKREYPGIIVFG